MTFKERSDDTLDLQPIYSDGTYLRLPAKKKHVGVLQFKSHGSGMGLPLEQLVCCVMIF